MSRGPCHTLLAFIPPNCPQKWTFLKFKKGSEKEVGHLPWPVVMGKQSVKKKKKKKKGNREVHEGNSCSKEKEKTDMPERNSQPETLASRSGPATPQLWPWEVCGFLFCFVLTFLCIRLLLSKTTSRGLWVAQRLSICLWLGCDPESWDQFPHRASCVKPVSPSAYVSVSLSLCLSWINK